MNTLKLWWWRINLFSLYDRIARLEQLRKEVGREVEESHAEASKLERRIQQQERRAAVGLRVI